MAGEESVRRAGLLKRLHLLSFTTLCLLSPKPFKAGGEITEKSAE